MNTVLALVERTHELSRRTRSMRAHSVEMIAQSRRLIAASTEMVEDFACGVRDDRALLRLTAREMVRRHRSDAVARIHQEEIAATHAGDRLSAEAWADIARVVEDLFVERVRHSRPSAVSDSRKI